MALPSVPNGSRQRVEFEFRQCVPTTSRIWVGPAARRLDIRFERSNLPRGFRGCPCSLGTRISHAMAMNTHAKCEFFIQSRSFEPQKFNMARTIRKVNFIRQHVEPTFSLPHEDDCASRMLRQHVIRSKKSSPQAITRSHGVAPPSRPTCGLASFIAGRPPSIIFHTFPPSE
jgi:hypothetical protein